MKYNTERTMLMIPEYGRHIHQMVDYCKTIEDKDKRNSHAQTIIDLMGNLNPHLRDIPDFQHKLWDQLFIMANFDLDVDSPYPVLKREEREQKPKPLKYPVQNYSHKYYGKTIREMIKVAGTWEESDKKELLIKTLANQMKKAYLNYNRNQVDDKTIVKHLNEISNGKISLDENTVLMQASNISTSNQQKRGKKRKSKPRKY
ncbi:MAG: DUF4290 domain-containing protein [Flavobacteriales bacterium]|nr:DUF4290 domain-containing protein [Flavobacteriales bacterium]